MKQINPTEPLNHKQTAMLYTALVVARENYENQFSNFTRMNEGATDEMERAMVKRVGEFLRWQIKETNELINQFFGELDRPETLQLMPIFQQELPLEQKVLD